MAEVKEAKRKEGEELFKKAKGKCAPSLSSFRFKPDWETAGPLYERAALCFKQAGVLERAIAALENAALANERMASPWHAGKHLEACADLSKVLQKPEDVSAFYRRAAAQYMEAGRGAMGGEALAKGARAIEEKDPKTCVAMFNEAVAMYEAEGKEAQAADVYRAAVASMIKTQQWLEAGTMLFKFGAACDKANARSSQAKAYLSAVVVWLYAGEAKQAYQAYQDAMDIDHFISSDEAHATEALLFAYKTGNPANVKKAVSDKSVFKQLDNQVGRLAVKLPTEDFDRAAREVADLMGGGDGDVDSEEASDEDVL